MVLNLDANPINSLDHEHRWLRQNQNQIYDFTAMKEIVSSNTRIRRFSDQKDDTMEQIQNNQRYLLTSINLDEVKRNDLKKVFKLQNCMIQYLESKLEHANTRMDMLTSLVPKADLQNLNNIYNDTTEVDALHEKLESLRNEIDFLIPKSDHIVSSTQPESSRNKTVLIKDEVDAAETELHSDYSNDTTTIQEENLDPTTLKLVYSNRQKSLEHERTQHNEILNRPDVPITAKSNTVRSLRERKAVNYKLPDNHDPFDYAMGALKYEAKDDFCDLTMDAEDDAASDYIKTPEHEVEMFETRSDLDFVVKDDFAYTQDMDYQQSQEIVVQSSDVENNLIYEPDHCEHMELQTIQSSPVREKRQANHQQMINDELRSQAELINDVVIEDSNRSTFPHNDYQIETLDFEEISSEPESEKDLGPNEGFDEEREDLTQLNVEIEDDDDELEIISENASNFVQKKADRLFQLDFTRPAFQKKYSQDDSIPAQAQFPWSEEVEFRLKNTFKLKKFRANQLDAINATLGGRDVFVLMPTGGGKSLCYQLPAIVDSGTTSGTTIVISPLISLMQDQVEHLLDLNIKACMINSKMSAAQKRQNFDLFKTGRLDLVYVSPEMLNSSQQCKRALQTLHINNRLARFVIDEAHCVSNWGHDFRPDYKELSFFKRQFPNIPLVALTATANELVRSDIIKNLNMTNPLLLKQSFNRTNLNYIILQKNKDTINEICNSLKTDYSGMSGIIYCHSKLSCEKLAEAISNQRIRCAFYHAGMNPAERLKIQKAWQLNQIQVICATVAFGMGIDKSDVRFVYHFTIPRTLEGYYQETGRAGRDGKTSDCITYFAFKDVRSIQTMIQRDKGLNKMSKEKHLNKLQEVVTYCENSITCRREQVLKYFNETFNSVDCRNQCDNCRQAGNAFMEERDVTQFALNALQIVKELDGEKFTRLHCQDIFKGSRNAKIITSGHDNFEAHGSGKLLARSDVERLFSQLITERYLQEYSITNSIGYATNYVKLGPNARLLFGNKAVVKMNFVVQKNTLKPSLSSSSSTKSAPTTATKPNTIENNTNSNESIKSSDQATFRRDLNLVSNSLSTQNLDFLSSVYNRLKEKSLQLGNLMNPPVNNFLPDLILKDLAKRLPRSGAEFTVFINDHSKFKYNLFLIKDTIEQLRKEKELMIQDKIIKEQPAFAKLEHYQKKFLPTDKNFNQDTDMNLMRQIQESQYDNSAYNSSSKSKKRPFYRKGFRKYRKRKR